MVIKEKKVFETEDGYTFNTIEEAKDHENLQELYDILAGDMMYSDSLSIEELWDVKDKLIQFFINKGYVNKKEE